MEIKHYVKIFDDANDRSTRHQVKVRSFNDETFKSVHKDEPHFTFFSRCENTVALDAGFKLYLTSGDLFDVEYFLTEEDIENFGDLEQKNAYNLIGALSGTETPDEESKEMEERGFVQMELEGVAKKVPTEEELRIRYNRAYLENGEGQILSQADLGVIGLSTKHIQDFCDSIEAVRGENENLTFDQIIEGLLSDSHNDATHELYLKIAKLIERTPKFEAMKSLPKDVQLRFDEGGNISGEDSGKQKQQ